MDKNIWERFVKEIKLCEEGTEYIVDSEAAIHNKHDRGYKSLLSIKKNFIDFIKTFVKDEVGKEIVEEDVTLLDKEFITSNFGKRESDLIYEIKSSNKNIYFILIELQRKVDMTMSYRILNYMVEIWRKWELSRDKNEKFVLPKIIPCVLYNGKSKWNAPLELKYLYDDTKGEYLLNYKYILIDVYRYTEEELLSFGNMISSAFYLDTASKSNMEYRLNKLGERLKKSRDSEIEQFVNWAVNILVLDENKQKIIREKIIKEDDEMGNLARIGREIFNDGLCQGRKEGEVQGKIEAKISLIQKILSKKLNSFPPQQILIKLNVASIEKLEEIEDKLFDIESWNEVKNILE